jgi:hypothetical protein
MNRKESARDGKLLSAEPVTAPARGLHSPGSKNQENAKSEKLNFANYENAKRKDSKLSTSRTLRCDLQDADCFDEPLECSRDLIGTMLHDWDTNTREPCVSPMKRRHLLAFQAT